MTRILYFYIAALVQTLVVPPVTMCGSVVSDGVYPLSACLRQCLAREGLHRTFVTFSGSARSIIWNLYFFKNF